MAHFEIKKNSGEGHSTLSRPLLQWEGAPTPHGVFVARTPRLIRRSPLPPFTKS